MALLEVQLEKLLKILPPRRDVQDVLRRFRALAEQEDFVLSEFRPGAEAQKDFYNEWPITVRLQRHLPQPGALLRSHEPLLANLQRRQPADLAGARRPADDPGFVHRQDLRLPGERSRRRRSRPPPRRVARSEPASELPALRGAPRRRRVAVGGAEPTATPRAADAQATPDESGDQATGEEAQESDAPPPEEPDLEAIERMLREDEEVLGGSGYAYDPGDRRDPFLSLAAGDREQAALLGPRPDGVPGLLIDEIEVTGVFVTPQGAVAQVQAADKAKSYLLHVGDDLYDGSVVAIHFDRGQVAEVVFKQDVRDPTAAKPFREVIKQLNPS